MDIDSFLPLVHGAKCHGSYYTAKCPAHDDKQNSLSISQGEGGRVLLKCHANCEVSDILAALDLGMKDLFPDGGQLPPRREAPKAAAKPKTSRAPRSDMGTIVKQYPYTDEDGNLLYEAVRLEPKSFRQRQPKQDEPGKWIWSLTTPPVRRVLYRLPAVLEAVRTGRRIFIVEGEKDVETLERLGIIATTNAMGAGKWLPEYTETICGARRLVIFPDNDKAGRDHAERVKAELPQTVIVCLPGLAPGGDVTDWINSGHTLDDLKALVVAAEAADSAPPASLANDPEFPNGVPDEAPLLVATITGSECIPYTIKPCPTTAFGKYEDHMGRLFPVVLAPGLHYRPNGESINITNDDFVKEALRHVPEDKLYRSGNIIGEMEAVGGRMQWTQLDNSRVRNLISRYVSVQRWKIKSKPNGEEDHIIEFVPPTQDMGRLLLAQASTMQARKLTMISTYPMFGPDWKLLPPGWDAATGIYYHEPALLEGLQGNRDPAAIRKGLRHLLGDFPIEDDASWFNFIALMLTPIIAAAIDWANRPWFLLSAPIAGAGKTKLAEQVLGNIVLGTPTPATQFSKDEAEFRKVILSKFMQSKTVLHLDNMSGHINSSTLASLSTARMYSDRALATNNPLEFDNFMTVVGSGNNNTMTEEIRRRCIWVRLVPRQSRPELRQNFRIPDIDAHTRSERRNYLSMLIGLVEEARDRGYLVDPNIKGHGSFEAWAKAMRGILRVIDGEHELMGNYAALIEALDKDGEEKLSFVEAWWDAKKVISEVPVRRTHRVVSTQLTQIAKDHEMLTWMFQKNEASALQRMRSFMVDLMDAPIGRYFVHQEYNKHLKAKEYWLEVNEHEISSGDAEETTGDVNDQPEEFSTYPAGNFAEDDLAF